MTGSRGGQTWRRRNRERAQRGGDVTRDTWRTHRELTVQGETYTKKERIQRERERERGGTEEVREGE